MAATLRDRLPLLSDLAGVQPASLTPEAAGYRFFRSRDHLRFSRDRSVAHEVARAADRMVIDSRVPSSDPSSIRARPIDLEYLISIHVYPLILGCQYVLAFSSLHVDFTGPEADDMASPHRSESFFHDGPALPSILLVPIGDGDSFDVVLGPVLTLVRSEEASFEQESPLAVEPIGDEPLLIERGPSHISSSPDRQPLVATDGAVSSELIDSQVEDLTEQAAVDYDYELDESWLAEQLLDSPEAEVLTSEGLAEAHASPSTYLFPLSFICSLLFMYLCLLFYFVAGSNAPAGPPEAADTPIPDPVPPVSGDEAIGWIFSLLFFLFLL
jgi:hypothetical protein